MKRLIASFSAQFEQTTVLQWNLLNDGTLQALFKKNGHTWEAIFEASGKLIRSSVVKQQI